jgi:hypothetical protein
VGIKNSEYQVPDYEILDSTDIIDGMVRFIRESIQEG